MRLANLIPVLASAADRPALGVRESLQHLRRHGVIAGTGMKGGSSPTTNPHEVADVLLTLLSTHKTTEAAAAFERASGLIAEEDGGRIVRLRTVLQGALVDLVKRGKLSGGVTDFNLSMSWPWPFARLRLTLPGGTERGISFVHEDAVSSGDAAWDAARLEMLKKEWRYKPDRTRWAHLDLAHLTLLADVLAGRVTLEAALPPRPEPVEPWIEKEIPQAVLH